MLNSMAFIARLKCSSRCFLKSPKLGFVLEYSTLESHSPTFGLFFDIDGVIVRGKNLLPFAPEAFRKLVNDDGTFRIPSVFVTNAGNTMRHQKAEQLSAWLGIQIHADQVVMSHSPLKMFKEFHKKHMLLVGQGPLHDIAKGLGFTNITTVDELREHFPNLDAIDHKRRQFVPCGFEDYFPCIEGIALMGEPVRWETSLQLLSDTLITNGKPNKRLMHLPKPHLPILACNMDLRWMAEAVLPRFGHGAFLVCLENLYKKITGDDLVYTALIGKPSEVTYHYAERVMVEQAHKLGIHHPIRTIYCIGDNISTDIFGANLYNQYLKSFKGKPRKALLSHARCQSVALKEDDDDLIFHAEDCLSVLVKTGVYNAKDTADGQHDYPRDFLPVEEKLRQPTYVVDNVLTAINTIFKKEHFY